MWEYTHSAPSVSLSFALSPYLHNYMCILIFLCLSEIYMGSHYLCCFSHCYQLTHSTNTPYHTTPHRTAPPPLNAFCYCLLHFRLQLKAFSYLQQATVSTSTPSFMYVHTHSFLALFKFTHTYMHMYTCAHNLQLTYEHYTLLPLKVCYTTCAPTQYPASATSQPSWKANISPLPLLTQ